MDLVFFLLLLQRLIKSGNQLIKAYERPIL